jgi:hypothetical protein
MQINGKKGLFMAPPKAEPAKCPKCQGDLIYIEHYQSYYCPSCDEHFEISDDMPKQAPESTPSVPSPTDVIDELIRSEEAQLPPQETVQEPREYKRPPPPPIYEGNQEPSTVPQQSQYEEPQYEVEQVTQEYQEPLYEEEQVAQEYQEPQYEEEQVAQEYQDPQEPVYEEGSQEILDEDYETQFEDEGPSVEGALETQTEGKGKKRKRRFKNYRYRTRMIKGSLLPIIFGLISFQMINSSRLQFPDYYEMEAMIILAGFVLGFSSISAITLVNLVKAKKSDKKGFKLNMMVGVAAYLPFIVIFLGLTLFVSLSTGWQFATGFFLASIFPIMIVTLFEATSKGKFFVKEVVDDPSWGRKLVFKS